LNGAARTFFLAQIEISTIVVRRYIMSSCGISPIINPGAKSQDISASARDLSIRRDAYDIRVTEFHYLPATRVPSS
jgi:hypothetical protein